MEVLCDACHVQPSENMLYLPDWQEDVTISRRRHS